MMNKSCGLTLLVTALLVGGCEIFPTTSLESIPLVVDRDCGDATSLERDLSDRSTYEGSAQVYLTKEGETCRY